MKGEENIKKGWKLIKKGKIKDFSLKSCSLMIRHTEQWIYRNYLKLQRKTGQSMIKKPTETVYIPLRLIKYKVTSPEIKHFKKRKFIFSTVYNSGIILGGNWDIRKERVDKKNVTFTAIRERIKEGKNWEETIYYNYFKNNIGKKNSRRNCLSWKEFKEKHLSRWDIISKTIKKEGYKSQKEVGGIPEKEILVCVSRDGEIMRIPGGGQHRFAIAKVLDIKEIPVTVIVWHEDYIKKAKKKMGINKITPKEAIKIIFNKEERK